MFRPKPSYIGSFIYSYAITLMYDNILSKYLVYYTDTDSALVSVRTSRKMRHLMGGNFGQMSDDLNGSKVDSSYIVSAKTYGLFFDGKCVKSRCKGVRPSDSYVVGEYDDESYPRISGGDIKIVYNKEVLDFIDSGGLSNKEKENMYIAKKKANEDCENFYSLLCSGNKISLDCDVFKKGMGLDENSKKYFKLCHAKMIKVI